MRLIREGVLQKAGGKTGRVVNHMINICYSYDNTYVKQVY